MVRDSPPEYSARDRGRRLRRDFRLSGGLYDFPGQILRTDFPSQFWRKIRHFASSDCLLVTFSAIFKMPTKKRTRARLPISFHEQLNANKEIDFQKQRETKRRSSNSEEVSGSRFNRATMAPLPDRSGQLVKVIKIPSYF